jgi:hypothetical protein
VSRPNLVVLYRTMSEPNWQDSIDEENGLFVYFGDNRKPGFKLHEGAPAAAAIRYRAAHSSWLMRVQRAANRFRLSWTSPKGARGRDAVFHGLAALPPDRKPCRLEPGSA